MALYWQNETSGQMRAIVVKFLNGIILNERELLTLKRYIIQFIAAMITKPLNYVQKIEDMSQRQLQVYCACELLKMGIDPF